MAVRKKKTTEVVPVTAPVVKVEPPQRVVPEIPNTIHFYVYNQYLIRMESLDKKLKIDAELIKSILSEIKERNLLGTNLFTVIFNEETGETLLDEIIDLQEEDLDADLQKIINKIYSPLEEKTEDVK